MTRPLLPAILVAALAASALTAPPAAADREFTFFGSGYGHGLGMSQWGAHGLARMGWNGERIVEHFYRGTEVKRVDSLPRKIRVELLSGARTVHVGARGGRVRLWVGDARSGAFVDHVPLGETWTVSAKGSGYAIRDAAGRLVGGKRWGGPKRGIVATYEDTGSRVFVREADGVWGRGFEYNRGRLEFDLYSCTGTCAIRVVLPLRFEEYLYGLGEVPASWPVAALRAQAIAARSYAAAVIRRQGGLRPGCRCHLSDGVSDQVYIGYTREGAPDGDRWVAAVRDTRAQAATYRGAVIQAFYAASDGGHSENVEDVWHGGDDRFAIPWLRGVCNPGESTAGNPHTSWKVTFSRDSLTARLGLGIGRVKGFGAIRRGRSGRIVTAVVIGADGRSRIEGSDLRSRLGLRDTRVWIGENRNILPGPIRERYDDLGCRPGLPRSKQISLANGSQQLFARGGIFRNDGADVTVWIRGAIFDEYRAVRTGRGVLGLPTSPVVALDCPSCRRVAFEDGRIFLKRGVGAHALWGRVLTTFLDEGGTSGALGFPVTRVRRTADGGRRARFERGSIVCASGGGCNVSTS